MTGVEGEMRRTLQVITKEGVWEYAKVRLGEGGRCSKEGVWEYAKVCFGGGGGGGRCSKEGVWE
jgi:hypothetical protein